MKKINNNNKITSLVVIFVYTIHLFLNFICPSIILLILNVPELYYVQTICCVKQHGGGTETFCCWVHGGGTAGTRVTVDP